MSEQPQQPSASAVPPTKNYRPLIIGLVVIVALLAATVVYLLARKPAVTPTNNTSQSSITNKTSAFQTYQNSQYGFEMQIPKDWSVDASSKDELFFYSEASRSENALRDERCKTPLVGGELSFECSQRNIDMYFSSGGQGSNAAKKETINGVEWTVVEGENAGWRYESKHNGNFYSFKLPYLPENKAKMAQFLSTFKFTSASAAVPSDWKTYKNTDYGFQLTFTDAWKGYEVVRNQSINNSGSTYIFWVPTTDKKWGNGDGRYDAFVIMALDKNADKYWEGGGPQPTYLGSSQIMDFYATYAQDIPDDLYGKIDANQIVKSFKLVP